MPTIVGGERVPGLRPEGAPIRRAASPPTGARVDARCAATNSARCAVGNSLLDGSRGGPRLSGAGAAAPPRTRPPWGGAATNKSATLAGGHLLGRSQRRIFCFRREAQRAQINLRSHAHGCTECIEGLHPMIRFSISDMRRKRGATFTPPQINQLNRENLLCPAPIKNPSSFFQSWMNSPFVIGSWRLCVLPSALRSSRMVLP